MTAPANLYASRGDVNRWLPSGSLDGIPRLVESALASNDTITADGHGLETDDPIVVRAAEGGTLPVPLSDGATYYAIRVSNSSFKLAATAGGSAIDLTTNGTSVVISRAPPFDEVLEYYSRWVDTFFPAHLVPFTSPVHPLVKGLVAQLAAKALLNIDGKSSDIVNAAELSAKAQLERHAKGVTLRGAATTAPANLALVASGTTSTTSDSRGWGEGTLP